MKIDAAWHEAHTLRDGSRLVLRLLRPTDGEGLREGFSRLSSEARYRRFMTHLPALTDEMTSYLTEVDGERHLAIAAVVESADLKSEAGVGVARYVRLPDEPDVAEAAVTVVDDFHGRGVGKLLLTTLVRAAAERDIRKFRAEVLPENVAVQGLLASVGAVERERTTDSVIFDIPIPAEGDEGRWQGMFLLLRHAASSMALVFRHWWFGRAP